MSRSSRLSGAHSGVAGQHAEHAAENFAAGDLAQTERSCRRALARGTGDGDLWHMLAAILLAGNRLNDAIVRTRRLNPSDADYAHTEALLKERREDVDGAA